MVPLSLWDDISEERKFNLAQKILKQPKTFDNHDTEEYVGRIGTGYGKQDLHSVNSCAKNLCELITPASWQFFSILGISSNFLSLPVKEWEENEQYNAAKKTLCHLKVTNESAERSVKLCADFLGLAQKEDLFQDYLQVVENERKKTPNLSTATKRKLE